MHFLVNLSLIAIIAVSCSESHSPKQPNIKNCLLTNTCDAVVDPTAGRGPENPEDPEDPSTPTRSNDGLAILNKLVTKTIIEYKVISGSTPYARAKVHLVKGQDDAKFSLEVAFTALRDLTRKRYRCKRTGRGGTGYTWCYAKHKLLVELTRGSTPGSHNNADKYLSGATDEIYTNGDYSIEIKADMQAGNSFRLKFDVPVKHLADGSLVDSFNLATQSPHGGGWREFKSDGGQKVSASLKP